MTLAASRSALSLLGGSPVRQAPFPLWPVFDEGDAATAGAVLLSGRVNYWTGEHGRAFEGEFAAWSGSAHAVAVANGTLALEIALRALGVGPGDEVIVPSATFIATAAAVATCGARPVVVDVDPDSQALTPETVAPAVTERTVAVILVHVGGFPADAAAVRAFTDAHGLLLVEDCAQAHGARRRGRPVGTTGHVAAWSFCQDKILTTAGEGGAITTDDTALFQRCWELKDHGKGYAAVHHREHPPGFRWLHERFGTNARMTEVQAAVGRRHLVKLDRWVAQRRENAAALLDALGAVPGLRLPEVPEDAEPSWYRVYAQIREERLRDGWTRDRITDAITAEGVPCGQGGCAEIHREKAFEGVGRPDRDLAVAARLGRTSIALPVHPALGPTDIGDVADAVTKVLMEATR